MAFFQVKETNSTAFRIEFLIKMASIRHRYSIIVTLLKPRICLVNHGQILKLQKQALLNKLNKRKNESHSKKISFILEVCLYYTTSTRG